jgi:glycosyltransferase involved in cell wall biosynthesis
VASYAEKDRRIRLIRQSNAGVAQARNSGAASTDAEFLAFVDADDLWAPSKIALQLRALQEGGSSAGLAYCWFAQIDENGRVFSLYNRPDADGHVLQRMCRMNFVGNGSSMLLRRSAFERAGQFDPSLRARNAQGCEDLLMCLRIAESYEFRVVPQHLVGYRMTNVNMSSDVMQMLRSCEIVLAEFREKYPQRSRCPSGRHDSLACGKSFDRRAALRGLRPIEETLRPGSAHGDFSPAQHGRHLLQG